MARLPRLVLVTGFLLAVACAGGPAPSPSPAAPVSLEALVEAYASRPTFATALALGRARVGAGQLEQAAQSYRDAARLAQGRSQRAALDRALGDLGRVRLAAEARAAISREASLATETRQPNTIAVLPWTFVGTDESLAPLSVGLAHLFITDLATIPGLILVERERIQAMLDEMAMAGEGRVDQGTAARAGRLLRASRVVQGVVRQTSEGVRLEAAVVRTADGVVEASGSAGDRLTRLFALQKTVMLDLVGQLGIPLTPAERRRLTERPTEDLQAFLAFSRGLQAAETGDYRSATRLFAFAADRDPAFGAAGRLVDVTANLASRYNAVQSGVQGVAPSTGGVVDRRSRLPGGNSRLPEALGQDNPSKIAFVGEIIILIPRP